MRKRLSTIMAHLAVLVVCPTLSPSHRTAAPASPARASEAGPLSQDLTESVLSGIISVELALSRLEC
jgi:hypothetical protein